MLISFAMSSAARDVILLWGIQVIVGLAMPQSLAQAAPRDATVIFELAKPIQDLHDFNWFTQGTDREENAKRDDGAQQVMWEPLFILNYETGALDPWLATDIKRDPNQPADAVEEKWILTLRPGVEWSDGEAFDADDVVFTARMAIDDEDLVAEEASTLRAQVESVEKVDDLTVSFTLRKPNPRFAIENFGGTRFSSFLVMPEHIWNGEDPSKFAFDPPIGTGPYKFGSITADRAIWVRNDDWWGKKAGFRELPEPAELIWQVVPDEKTSADLLAKDALDAARPYTRTTFKAVTGLNKKVIAWDSKQPDAWRDPCPRQLEINTTHEPWDKSDMRKAVSLLIDRTDLAASAYDGGTVPSETMFAQYGAMAPFIDAVKPRYALPATAVVGAGQKLLEEAGYSKGADGIYEKSGTDLTLTISVDAAVPQDVRSVDVLVGQLKAAGIAAAAVPVPDVAFWPDIVSHGSYEMAYSWLSCGSVVEPWTSMSRYTADKVKPGLNRSPAYDNTGRWNTVATAAYSTVVDEIGKLPIGDPAIPDLVAKAYGILDAETPFIPLVQSATIIPFDTKFWTGWPTAVDNYGAPMHSWSRTHLIIHNLKSVK